MKIKIACSVFAATVALALMPSVNAAMKNTMKHPLAAATTPQIVHVGLTGEGGHPMGAKLDTTKIKAGLVEFDIKNEAIGTDHEAVLVKLKTKNDAIAADPASHIVNEKKLHSLGEVAGLRAGKTGVLKVKLQPGEYALICNHKEHFELGMSTRFTVVR